MSCQYFALCDNEAVGAVKNPILGNVPCCQRCADKLDLTLVFDPDYPNADLLPDVPVNWHESHENVVLLTRYLADEGHSAYNVADAVEKPWHWEDEYKFARYALESAR